MIKTVIGNIFSQNFDLLVHQTNTQGKMGKGFALQVRKKYPEIYEAYMNDYKSGNLALGYTGIYPTHDGKYVANLCGQEKYGTDGKQYTDYTALNIGLGFSVAKFAYNYNLHTIAIPGYMGCRLGGGDWNRVLRIIYACFENNKDDIYTENLDVIVCFKPTVQDNLSYNVIERDIPNADWLTKEVNRYMLSNMIYDYILSTGKIPIDCTLNPITKNYSIK